MKQFIYILILVTTILHPSKAYSGIMLKASALLVEPVISEVKNYNNLKKTSKEYKKAAYNLTVADVYYSERIGFPNIKKVIDYALEASFEIERKNVIKTIFKDNDKEKNNDIKICLNNINYDELKNSIKQDIEKRKVEKNDRYIIVTLIKALETCSSGNFSNENQIQLKRDIEYIVEQSLRK